MSRRAENVKNTLTKLMPIIHGLEFCEWEKVSSVIDGMYEKKAACTKLDGSDLKALEIKLNRPDMIPVSEICY